MVAMEEGMNVPATTLNDPRDAAAICRARGWGAGTRLVGDEGCGPTVIEITAVGERLVLAREVTHKRYSRETTWCLDCRDWREWRPVP